MKKTLRYLGEFITYLIIIIFSGKGSNYLGINREKIFPLYYLIMFVIAVTVFYIRNYTWKKYMIQRHKSKNAL